MFTNQVRDYSGKEIGYREREKQEGISFVEITSSSKGGHV
jgi:hypothetical protein